MISTLYFQFMLLQLNLLMIFYIVASPHQPRKDINELNESFSQKVVSNQTGNSMDLLAKSSVEINTISLFSFSDFGDTIPNSCLSCHKLQNEELQFEIIHNPFSNNCSNCHLNHDSLNKKLLSLSTPDLCFNCHTEIAEAAENSKSKHEILFDKRNCMHCHSPHASHNAKLLINTEKELCLNCHNKVIVTDNGKIDNIKLIVKKSVFQHKILENGGCTPCHNPHSSTNHALLNESFPEGSYINNKQSSFDLCFGCHDNTLLDDSTTSTSTLFRHGNKNLHFLHVNREKGRNCTLCHSIHGSQNEHLIANKVSFGNWELPLKFEQGTSGGSCTPACHSTKTYTR
jgi:predicted CXXCH cytochrome family protein